MTYNSLTSLRQKTDTNQKEKEKSNGKLGKVNEWAIPPNKKMYITNMWKKFNCSQKIEIKTTIRYFVISSLLDNDKDVGRQAF